VAEAVLKDNARIVSGPLQNLTVTVCKTDAAPVFRNNASIVSRPSQNFAEKAWKNDAALVLKDNSPLFTRPSQHISKTTRQTSIPVEFGSFSGCDDTLLKAQPKTAPPYMFRS
jgi:hypothetical protein